MVGYRGARLFMAYSMYAVFECALLLLLIIIIIIVPLLWLSRSTLQAYNTCIGIQRTACLAGQQ